LPDAATARSLNPVESFVASTPDMYALLGCARRAAVALLEAPRADPELHQRLAYSLHGPKHLWRSAVDGVLSHDQAAAMVLADLVSWLRERGGRSEPSPQPQTVTALIAEIEAALFSGSPFPPAQGGLSSLSAEGTKP
jgi:hypothetical protein